MLPTARAAGADWLRSQVKALDRGLISRRQAVEVLRWHGGTLPEIEPGMMIDLVPGDRIEFAFGQRVHQRCEYCGGVKHEVECRGCGARS